MNTKHCYATAGTFDTNEGVIKLAELLNSVELHPFYADYIQRFYYELEPHVIRLIDAITEKPYWMFSDATVYWGDESYLYFERQSLIEKEGDFVNIQGNTFKVTASSGFGNNPSMFSRNVNNIKKGFIKDTSRVFVIDPIKAVEIIKNKLNK